MAKKATKKKATKKKTRRKKADAGSRGLLPSECLAGKVPDQVGALTDAVESDGGAVLASYRDPLGGTWQMVVALPLGKVQPAPFQRDLSDTHVKALEKVIDRLDRFLDPIVVVRTAEGDYWTPNGHHRLAAMRKLGAKSIVCLLIPEFELTFQILALNTEKSPDLKARSLEVIRLARALSAIAPAPESDYAIQFDEEAGLLTLGGCYEAKARFAGSTYRPILKRCDAFLELDLADALEVRAVRAAAVVEVEAIVDGHVKALKARGADGSFIKTWVVARINPLRGGKGKADFDETLAKLRERAEAFDPASVDLRQLGAG